MSHPMMSSRTPWQSPRTPASWTPQPPPWKLHGKLPIPRPCTAARARFPARSSEASGESREVSWGVSWGGSSSWCKGRVLRGCGPCCCTLAAWCQVCLFAPCDCPKLLHVTDLRAFADQPAGIADSLTLACHAPVTAHWALHTFCLGPFVQPGRCSEASEGLVKDCNLLSERHKEQHHWHPPPGCLMSDQSGSTCTQGQPWWQVVKLPPMGYPGMELLLLATSCPQRCGPPVVASTVHCTSPWVGTRNKQMFHGQIASISAHGVHLSLAVA